MKRATTVDSVGASTYRLDDVLGEIDALELGDRLIRWKEARRNTSFAVSVERDRLALESWKETEGEDIEIRRARLVEKIAQGLPIDILDDDLIVGRISTGLLDAVTQCDVAGDYIPGLWEDQDEFDLTMMAKGGLPKEDRDVLREAASYFHPRSAGAHVAKAWQDLVGAWADDIEEARLRDPWLSAAFFPATVTSPLWGKVLANGLRDFISRAQAKIDWFLETGQSNMDQLYFWRASIMTCEALISYAHRYARLAREKADTEKDPNRKEELLGIADVCDRVPEHPARSFHEAVQCMHFIYLGKSLEQPTYSPVIGRADQVLWPYFERDFESASVTLDRAAELLECAIGHWGSHTFVANADFRENHQVNYMLNSISIGGLDRDGKDASNLLSYLILHVVSLLQLSAPSVTLQWHRDLPKWLMDKAIETNVKTKGGFPLFENAEHITEYFVGEGVPVEEARDWYTEGCITPIISNRIDHYGAEGTGSFNVAGILDAALHDGVSPITGKNVGTETGDPRSFGSFDDVYDAFKKQYQFIVGRMLWLSKAARQVNERYLRFPFLSTVMADGCMEYGEDLMHPNPAYHTFLITDRAIVDTADSLTAIKSVVFDEKKLTMVELMDAIDSNFEGERGEEIRRICLEAPKFGNDIEEADLMVRDVGAFSASVIRSFDNSPYPRFKISREGLSWHYFAGLGVGALPNGRKSQEPLNDGSISPMRGMDKLGPTAVLRSVLKAGFEDISAAALNQKFSATAVRSPESREKLALLTDVFMKEGGQHIQYNLVDGEELRDAKVHPDDHRNLIVRIGGFSAYFVELTPEIQDDVINRSEQAL